MGVHAELGVDAPDVGLDGVQRQAGHLGDDVVVPSLAQQKEDLLLPRGQSAPFGHGLAA